MKKILLLAIILGLSSLFAVAEDTGKYRILNYQVTLTPYSDGRVKMEYYQKWQVTEGHVPWMTVGLPNSDFKITGKSLNIAKIADANESDWEGVHIDLDKDYQVGQTFQVRFTIDENKLFASSDNKYSLDFTPGWYDRAFIDSLKICVKCFFKLDSVTTDPKPLLAKDATIIWLKTKLAKGEKFEVKLSFPQNLFPKKIADDNLKSSSLGTLLIIFLIVLGVLLLIVLIGAACDGDGGYSGGGFFFGGGGGSDGLSGGGGGGFGGNSSSCACVSCACACACAGGGGAGCSRKNKHECPICQDQDRK